MKKIYLLFALFLNAIVLAQAPQKMSYQAVIRDASNNLITSTNVGIRVSILQGSSTGTEVYQETHSATTNINGLVSLEVGTGTVVSGTFSGITWSTGNFYIKTETDPTGGTNYTITGTSQLLSVPYALYADSSGSGSSNSWTMNGNDQYATTSGNVGIGTTSPSEKLAVNEGNLLNSGTYGSSSTLTANGAGTRMFFYPKKAAFRAGYVSGTRWDEANIGNYSIAMGYNSSATADNTISIGRENVVSALRGVALGNFNDVTSSYAFGIGHSNTSSGNGSFAIGEFATSTATKSYAFGHGANASGNYSMSLGTSNSATGSYAVGIGYSSNASGNYSSTLGHGINAYSYSEIALGAFNTSYTPVSSNSWNTSDRLLSVGNGTSTTNRSDALTILKSGNVGIGTATPSEKFEVVGNTKTTNLQVTNGATNGYILQSDANGNGTWVNPSTFSGTETDPQVASTTTNYIPKWNGTALADGLVYDSGTNIGIGTSTPTEKLEVSGKTKTIEFQLTNGATNGYVLQSDANGNGTWVNPSTFSGTETDPQVASTTTNYIPKWNGTALADGLVYDNGTNIGIGTSSPSDKLHVVGSARIDAGRLDFRNIGQSVFIGESAGLNDDLTNNQNVFLGYEAGKGNTSGNLNAFIGHAAGNDNTTGGSNTALGQAALKLNTTGGNNTAIGRAALLNLNGGTQNTIVGNQAFQLSTAGSHNVALGFAAGQNNLTGNRNVFLGYSAGYDETGSNKLYITNTTDTTPLIYGEFDNDLLRVNGTLNINNAYSLPTTAGTANYILQTNGTGTTSWVNPTSLSNGNWTTSGSNQYSALSGNVGIGTSTPSDKLHVVGNMRIDAGRLNFENTGKSVFIGKNAGAGDSFGGNNQNLYVGEDAGALNTSGFWNVYLGSSAGKNIVTGNYNVAVGQGSIENKTEGSNNTAIGQNALRNNLVGNNNTAIGANAGLNNNGYNNVFLGYNAGQNETGSAKLYIDYTNTSTPLIYGDFFNKQLNFNGNVTVNSNAASTSTFAVNGSVATKFKTPLVAGTTNPDATGMTWRYTSGSGTITLPSASTCPDRIYVIINQTGSTRTISSYRDLTTTPQTTLGSSVALWLQSDGTEWWQIK
jgi:Head domain of trimeric autotransporter adhesin